MYPFLRAVCVVLLLCLYTSFAWAQTRRVVTYIEDVQEERKSTRWTLTEWLRIKERMKLMDVWLAMFSDPGKDKFAPELSLGYGRAGGTSRFQLGSRTAFNEQSQTSEDPHLMETGRLQFWFTNLVSSTTGLRTLAIDLGLEASFGNRFMDANQSLISPLGATTLTTDTDKLQKAGANFRIFGANEQDSGLVAKIGKFNRSTGYSLAPYDEMSGTYYGGEMALYFLKWLGAEGNYYAFKPDIIAGQKAAGTQIDYLGFLEFYNIRLGYGGYKNTWTFENSDQRLDSKETGKSFLLRLYF